MDLGRFLMLLLAFLLHLPAILSHPHSLTFFMTAVSSPLPGFPSYLGIGYVDDVFVVKYTSDSRIAQPALQWMAERVEPKHWQMLTQLGQHYENLHKNYMIQFRNLHNQTKGLSVFQVKFACHKHEDGSIGGYLEFGFNGKEFIVFDKDNLVYIPVTHEAHIITQRWNSEEFSGQGDKHLMENECIEWMDKYFLHGKQDLERKVPPRVKITDQESGGVTKLRCHVYGFYPRDVDVKWMKNGIDEVYSDEAKQILPNTDGTYQIRVSVEVTPKEGDSYSCYVDHSSLEKELIVPWDPKISSHTWTKITVGVVIILVCVLIAVFGVFAYRRFPYGRRQMVNTEET